MKLRKQMAAAVLAAAALSLSLPLSQAQDTPSPDHMLGLTAEQRMEDYKYLWSVLADSYPCWGILDREGVDVEGIYTSYRDMVAESDSDQTFYQAVYSTLFLLGNNGHLSIVEPADYFSLLPSARLYRRSGQTAWADILERKETREKYRSLLALDRAINSSGEEEEPALETPAPAAGGVIPLLLPESGVGYVKIDSFPAEYEADRAILSDFYRQCGDCTDLIFDLTDNSGGSEAYWEELLVAPHIDEPLSSEHLALVRHSRNNAPYLDQVFPAECLLPLNQLPSLPHLEPGDLDLATHFVRVCHRVEPADQPSPFRGRIWVLADESVYSASESFALFCQQTGFATLVGSATSGDGIGTDPVFLQLPNSGILVQYTPVFGLNPDGSSNEELGTLPDLLSPPGEPPLITALRAISQA